MCHSSTTNVYVIAAAIAFSVAGKAVAEESPDPNSVRITAFSHAGDGCPQGSVASNLSPDAKALSLLFDRYFVDASANQGNETKKTCWVNLNLSVPPGWSYTLFSVDYRGYVSLADGDNARLRSWYSLDGSQQIRISNLKVEGPLDQDYALRAWVPLDTLPWLQCSRPSSAVAIQTELMAEGDRAMITVDSLDGHFQQTYGIAWRRCSTSTQWVGSCQAVLETVWGTDMNRFTGTGIGRDHISAKAAAQQQATSQCETARRRLRPLVQSTTRCVIDQPYCTATPR